MTRTTPSGPRILLRRLREVMAEHISAQSRLDRIVVMIASNMVAEVCSVYVLRADGVLELFATEGLRQESVHSTSMKVGQGLVGTIAAEAQPLNLEDAQSHPAFAYFPETGEEIYHAFLGVPILRAGNTLGVLTVQNRISRLYSEEEVETLQTVAMVLAELIATGELSHVATADAGLQLIKPRHEQGIILAEGIGLGYVVLHEPRIIVQNLIAEDVDFEIQRLKSAIDSVRGAIDDMLLKGELASSGEHRDIMEAYRMFAHDRSWFSKMREAIQTGLTAEAAVERVQSDTRARFMRSQDAYIRDRLHDLEDLGYRLQCNLMGIDLKNRTAALPENAILVARHMGPAALLDYNQTRMRGLVLEEGAVTSHVSIVARALGFPAVGQVSGITSYAEQGDPIIVDGTTGAIYLRPTIEIESAYAEKVRFRARRQAQYAAQRETPAITKDGTKISLNLNAGLLVDLPHMKEAGADGIGLFRTELLFMVSSKLPSVAKQTQIYTEILDAADGAPVTFRSLDIGGDKPLPYIKFGVEENPALGWRAIRLTLDRPALMRAQIRALLKAASGRDLKLMFPMISHVNEFERAKAHVEKEKAYLKKIGMILPKTILLGAMVEVPSILWSLDKLCEQVDFLSVGTNDLTQFLFAIDRGNSKLQGRVDSLHLTVLKVMQHIISTANKHSVPVTVCGELAGKPLDAMALLALGYRSLSMSAASVGPIKSMILGIELPKLERIILDIIEKNAEEIDIRKALADFAHKNRVPLN